MLVFALWGSAGGFLALRRARFEVASRCEPQQRLVALATECHGLRYAKGYAGTTGRRNGLGAGGRKKYNCSSKMQLMLCLAVGQSASQLHAVENRVRKETVARLVQTGDLIYVRTQWRYTSTLRPARAVLCCERTNYPPR
jgi:hypothetical protein